jgi:hypothetical protein
MEVYTVVFSYKETVDGFLSARLRIEHDVEAPSPGAAIATVAGRCPATPDDAVAFHIEDGAIR